MAYEFYVTGHFTLPIFVQALSMIADDADREVRDDATCEIIRPSYKSST